MCCITRVSSEMPRERWKESLPPPAMSQSASRRRKRYARVSNVTGLWLLQPRKSFVLPTPTEKYFVICRHGDLSLGSPTIRSRVGDGSNRCIRMIENGLQKSGEERLRTGVSTRPNIACEGSMASTGTLPYVECR